MSRPDEQSSTLLVELKRRVGHDRVLDQMIQGGYPLTADEYIKAQWLGDTPEEIDAKEAEVIALLSAYERLQQQDTRGIEKLALVIDGKRIDQ